MRSASMYEMVSSWPGSTSVSATSLATGPASNTSAQLGRQLWFSSDTVAGKSALPRRWLVAVSASSSCCRSAGPAGLPSAVSGSSGPPIAADTLGRRTVGRGSGVAKSNAESRATPATARWSSSVHCDPSWPSTAGATPANRRASLTRAASLARNGLASAGQASPGRACKQASAARSDTLPPLPDPPTSEGRAAPGANPSIAPNGDSAASSRQVSAGSPCSGCSDAGAVPGSAAAGLASLAAGPSPWSRSPSSSRLPPSGAVSSGPRGFSTLPAIISASRPTSSGSSAAPPRDSSTSTSRAARSSGENTGRSARQDLPLRDSGQGPPSSLRSPRHQGHIAPSAGAGFPAPVLATSSLT
mmetsp:Transcript_4236/g.17917  ORF Transcript_4236/g.17917 Transcript_4236/m.17917 type:complete len:358 (+) Transcript_4236:1744-2817(+)